MTDRRLRSRGRVTSRERRAVTMIDGAPERMSRFNDREIRRKGKLLMIKVGRTVGGNSLDYKARAGESRVTNCAPKVALMLYSGIMDPGINETAARRGNNLSGFHATWNRWLPVSSRGFEPSSTSRRGRASEAAKWQEINRTPRNTSRLRKTREFALTSREREREAFANAIIN